jgi:phosphotransacetylase
MSREVKGYLRAKAKADPKKVVFPESAEERILRAARQVADLGIAHPILVGKAEARASQWSTTPMKRWSMSTWRAL